MQKRNRGRAVSKGWCGVLGGLCKLDGFTMAWMLGSSY